MSQPTAATKLLMFLSIEIELARLASSIFDEEAKKMDVIWNASAKLIPGSGEGSQAACEADAHDADLIVVLQRPGSKTSLSAIFPGWSGKAECWDLRSTSDDADLLRQNIANLMVKLILQGGKRQPTLETTISARPGPAISGADKQSAKSDAVRVQRESKGRGGKTVTLITGLGLEDAQLQDLAKRLKQLCGTGGTIKDGNIEIQGDQCDRILAELVKKGFKAKRAGG